MIAFLARSFEKAPRSLWAVFPVLLLCVCIALCYANVLQNGFVSDDIYIIVNNHDTLSLKSTLKSLMSPDRLVETNVLPYYRPLTRFSFLVDEHFFGKNPAGYHAVNVLLHMLCTVLFYFTLLRIGSESLSAFCAALLFGVHPVNAETVNFISTRNNMLAAVFVLASFLAFLRAEKKRSRAGHILSGAFFFFGMLSKETAIMLIPLLVIYKTCNEKQRRDLRGVLRWDFGYILPHVLFFVVYLCLRFFAIDNTYIHEHMAGVPDRIRQLLYIIPSYFTLVVWPIGLTLSHTVPKDMKAVMFPLILQWCALIAAAIYILRRRSGMSIFWLAWSVLNFIPVSGLIPFPGAPIAERFMYLPLIGVVAVTTDALYRRADQADVQNLLVVVVVCLSLAFGARTFARNFDWRDDLTLDRSLVRTDPSSPGNRYDLGYDLNIRGAKSDAQREFEKALSLNPRFDRATWAYYYLAVLSIEDRDLEKGKQLLQSSIKTDPHNYASQYALSWLLLQSGTKDVSGEISHLLSIATMSSLPFISDVNSMLLYRPVDGKRLVASRGTRSRIHVHFLTTKEWTLFHHFPTGTDLLYDPASVHHQGNEVTVLTRQIFSPMDRHSYALRLIRFPLELAREGRFLLTFNCPMNLYKMTSIEFRDDSGTVLGQIYPEQIASIQYEYLLPHSSLRSLSAILCSE